MGSLPELSYHVWPPNHVWPQPPMARTAPSGCLSMSEVHQKCVVPPRTYRCVGISAHGRGLVLPDAMTKSDFEQNVAEKTKNPNNNQKQNRAGHGIACTKQTVLKLGFQDYLTHESPTNSLRNLTHISVLLTRNIHMTITPLNMNREVYRVAQVARTILDVMTPTGYPPLSLVCF